MSNLTVADSFPRSASAERQPIVHVFHESLRNFTVEREPGNVQTNELVYYDAYGTPTSGSMAAFLPTNAEARLIRRRTMFRSQETSASPDGFRTDARLYSCRSAMLLGLRFPPSSLAGVVEIRELVPVACLWQGNNARASRCYEWRFLTSQCLLTKFRAAGCALLPERILRCRLIQTFRLYYTNFAGAKPPWQIRKRGLFECKK